MKNKSDKTFYTLEEMVELFKTQPKSKFLWSGIKENSFGLIFGPSKSGKTILCESLAMNIAIGAKEFLGYELDGIPKKVLFVGLEEYWTKRTERNISQLKAFSESDKQLLIKNYMYQPTDFSKQVIKDKDWEKLEEMIKNSEAKVVFIDSITRMNHGKLEDSKTAEQIMQRLRDLTGDLGITLICIHHTHKLGDNPIIMDSIKGSSTFAQESDFAFGVNRTSKNHRYIKEVFFRYADDGDQKVKEININDEILVELIGDADEDEILQRSDRRRIENKGNEIFSYFSSRPDITYSKNELVNYFTEKLNIKERMVENYLKEGIDKNVLMSPKRGEYKYNSRKNGL